MSQWNIEIAGAKEQVLATLQTETRIPQASKDYIEASIDAIVLADDDLALLGTYGVLVKAHGNFDDSMDNASYEMRRIKVGPPTMTRVEYDAKQSVKRANAEAAAKFAESTKSK